jgi:tRNA 2-thiocytidine biosynthesis protein TtcA
MKDLMRDWEKRFPGRVESIFRSLQDVRPSHLMDRTLYDFASVKATGVPAAEGDKAFDPQGEFTIFAALE